MSDDAKVAQGPWRAVQQDDGDWEVRAIINEQDHYVLIAFDNTEPVARKMAAAPDMLAALTRADRYIESTQFAFGETHQAIRAAIAKAEGAALSAPMPPEREGK